MKIARDINAEEPEKKLNGKAEREKQALPTQHAALKQADLLRHKIPHKEVVLLLMHQFPK